MASRKPAAASLVAPRTLEGPPSLHRGLSSANGTTSITGPAPPAGLEMHDRMLFLLLGLIGSRVVVTARSGGRYEGILSATATEGDLSVILKFAATVTEPDAPIKPSLTIASRDIVTIGAVDVDLDARTSAQPPSANPSGNAFRTDADISNGAPGTGEGRALQQWNGASASEALPVVDSLDAGKSSTWDQFAANERLYGVKTNYSDELYTTELDRSGKDFADRERRAARVAQEILSSAPVSAHVAEERNITSSRPDNLTEEDKCVHRRRAS